ncbi:MAG: hypothetical protein LUB83_04675 [Prevotellaceae bacterium]|nr:hypothetical protein [Prevotellaceae bacterium]
MVRMVIIDDKAASLGMRVFADCIGLTGTNGIQKGRFSRRKGRFSLFEGHHVEPCFVINPAKTMLAQCDFIFL